MIRLRVVQRVPDIGVNISYVKNMPASPQTNIALLDYSRGIIENGIQIGADRAMLSQAYITPGFDGTPDTPTILPHTYVSPRALAFSWYSVNSDEFKKAKPLYYKHKLGKGAYQNAISWPIRLTMAIDHSKHSPKEYFRITDENGNEVEDFYWDIFLTEEYWQDGVYTDGGRRYNSTIHHSASSATNISHETKRYILYADRIPKTGKTYFIHFHAYNEVTGQELPNYKEVLTLQPDSAFINDTHFADISYPDLDHAGDLEGKLLSKRPILTRAVNSLGYYCSTIPEVNLDAAMSAPLFTLYGDPDIYRLQYETSPKAWKIQKNDGGWSDYYTLTLNAPVTQLCKEINDLEIDLKAVPNTNIPDTSYMIPSSEYPSTRQVTWPFPQSGNIIRYYGDVADDDSVDSLGIHYQHMPNMSIRPLLPTAISSAKPWYPRIQAGEFTIVKEKDAGDGYWEYRYGVPEIYNNQEWSRAFEPGVREVTYEPAYTAGKHVIQTNRSPIYKPETIEVRHEENGIMEPAYVDLQNGKLFFNEEITDPERIKLSYAFNDNTYEYTDIDLNPNNNPQYIGKFVGLYAVPMEVKKTTGSYSELSGWLGSGEAYYYESDNYTITPSNSDIDFHFNWFKPGYHSDVTGKFNIELIGTRTGAPTARVEWTVYLTKTNSRGEEERIASGYAYHASTTPTMILLREENESGLSGYMTITDGDTNGWMPGAAGETSTNLTAVVKDERRTIHHTIKDTISEIETEIEAYGSDEFAYTAKLLGVYQVSPFANSEEIQYLDTRTRGGGFKEHVDTNKLKEEEGRMNFDLGFWDGEPFQSTGSLIVNLPSGIPLKDREDDPSLTGWPASTDWQDGPNNMSREEIREKIKNWMALGVLPIVSYQSYGSGEYISPLTGDYSEDVLGEHFLEDFEEGWD